MSGRKWVVKLISVLRRCLKSSLGYTWSDNCRVYNLCKHPYSQSTLVAINFIIHYMLGLCVINQKIFVHSLKIYIFSTRENFFFLHRKAKCVQTPVFLNKVRSKHAQSYTHSSRPTASSTILESLERLVCLFPTKLNEQYSFRGVLKLLYLLVCLCPPPSHTHTVLTIQTRRLTFLGDFTLSRSTYLDTRLSCICLSACVRNAQAIPPWILNCGVLETSG